MDLSVFAKILACGLVWFCQKLCVNLKKKSNLNKVLFLKLEYVVNYLSAQIKKNTTPRLILPGIKNKNVCFTKNRKYGVICFCK